MVKFVAKVVAVMSLLTASVLLGMWLMGLGLTLKHSLGALWSLSTIYTGIAIAAWHMK